MATAKASIIIDGTLVDPYSISLEQPFNWHHTFEIAVASDKVEGKNCMSIDQSIQYVGKTADINIFRVGNELKFKGIITSVHLDRTYAGDSLIVFTGYSPTYLLEDGEGTKSYAEKSISGIANEILGQYPANLLNSVVSPNYTGSVPYIVRYKETQYEFLSRIASTYGEWFYYDGQNTIFGKLPNPDSIDLTLGRDLKSFGYGVNVKPSKFKYQFYKYEENRTLEKTSASYSPGWLDNYGQKALAASNAIFPAVPVNPVWHDAKEDSLIRHLAEVKKSSILSDTTFFRGESHNPGITVGSRIGGNAFNKVNGTTVPGFIGRFRVTKVVHKLDHNKDYTNSFEAIPIAVTAPPVNKNVRKPEAEPQVAVVIDNNDPEQMGRVRVQYKWQTGGEITPWIRVLTSSASGGRGMYFIAEIGDEAYVNFDQGNPDRPYVAGTLFHSNARPIWGSAGNDTKAIRTRSGNRIELNDADGSVNIIDPSGNTVTMGGNGEITISAPSKITLSSTDIVIAASNNFTVSAGNNIAETAGNNFTESAGNNITETAGNNVAVSSGNNISETAGNNIAVCAANCFESIAGSSSEIIGQSKVLVKSGAAKVSLKCAGLASMKAAISTSVQAGISTTVQAGVISSVSAGAIVKVNGAQVSVNG